MDLLYIVGKNSKCDDFELRCSLRSIEKYGRNVGNVYVVGHCPDWLSDNVHKLPCEDYNTNTVTPVPKAQNIAKKLLYAVDNSDIGEEFLVSMDDHFYIRETDFDNYPYYANRNMGGAHIVKNLVPNGEYSEFIKKCGENLISVGLSDICFVLHRNFHVSRKSISECREIINTFIENNRPFEVFLLLLNHVFTTGGCVPEFARDVRLSNGSEWWKTATDHVFSTADFRCGSGLHTLMRQLYDKPSKYEKVNVSVKSPRTAEHLLSVVLPFYNVEDYLDESISSVLLSTHANFELLLIDDGSTDKSLDVCKSWARKDARIRVIHCEHKGVSAARNAGIEQARGKWVAFVDSDDWVEKDMYKKLIASGEQYDCPIVRCGEKRKSYKSEYIRMLHESGIVNIANATPPAYDRGTINNGIYLTEFLRRHKIEFPDCELAEDFLFNVLAYTYSGRLCNVNEVLYTRRQRKQSLCSSFYDEPDMTEEKTTRILRMIKARSEIAERLEREPNYKYLRDLLFSETRKFDDMLNK